MRRAGLLAAAAATIVLASLLGSYLAFSRWSAAAKCIAGPLQAPLGPSANGTSYAARMDLTMPDYAAGALSCLSETKALIVALPYAHPTDLVSLRRFCELAGLVFKSWKLRIYLNERLTEGQLRVLRIRCTLCVEEVVVKSSVAPLWWSKFHALGDPSLERGLFRSIYSRPTQREADAVETALAGSQTFHVLRDHPELHNVPLVPHLWGFQGGGGGRDLAVSTWQATEWIYGEAVFLAEMHQVVRASLRELTSFASSFSALNFNVPRRGVEYCGRLADHKERDMQQGYKAFLHQMQERRHGAKLPECLSQWTSKDASWAYSFPLPAPRRDEERRYLSYNLYGSRAVDKNEMIKVLQLLKRRDFYWSWGVLLFVRDDVPPATVRELVQVGYPLEVYLVSTTGSCGFLAKDPRMWRAIFPMDLPHVDRFVSRDADSVIWHREWHAVVEWIESGLNFHLMRDHSNGHDWAVMAGMWGAISGSFPLMEMAKRVYPQFSGTDQDLMAQQVWPHIGGMQMGHDSQHCLKYHALPFPDPPWIHFVGQTPTYKHDTSPDVAECTREKYDDFEI